MRAISGLQAIVSALVAGKVLRRYTWNPGEFVRVALNLNVSPAVNEIYYFKKWSYDHKGDGIFNFSNLNADGWFEYDNLPVQLNIVKPGVKFFVADGKAGFPCVICDEDMTNAVLNITKLTMPVGSLMYLREGSDEFGFIPSNTFVVPLDK